MFKLIEGREEIKGKDSEVGTNLIWLRKNRGASETEQSGSGKSQRRGDRFAPDMMALGARTQTGLRNFVPKHVRGVNQSS